VIHREKIMLDAQVGRREAVEDGMTRQRKLTGYSYKVVMVAVNGFFYWLCSMLWSVYRGIVELSWCTYQPVTLPDVFYT